MPSVVMLSVLAPFDRRAAVRKVDSQTGKQTDRLVRSRQFYHGQTSANRTKPGPSFQL
jgi:hypothetical protein